MPQRTPEAFAPGHARATRLGAGLPGPGRPPATGSDLRGVRGEVVRLYAPEVTLQRPTRLVHPRYPIYLAPKEDHVFVIGATEIESDDLSAPASVRSTLELLSAALRRTPWLCRGAHSRNSHPVPPHPARQPARHAPARSRACWRSMACTATAS